MANKKKRTGRTKPQAKNIPSPSAEPRRWQKKQWMILGGSVLGVLVIAAAVLWLVLHGYLTKINYSDGQTAPDVTAAELTEPAGPGSPDAGEEDAGTAVTRTAEDPTAAAGAEGQTAETVPAEPAETEEERKLREAEESLAEITTILLIGSDTRVSGQAGRSDSMMLLTINRKTETISLTSLLRDMYVAIPGRGDRRINSAFSMGGAALLEETVEKNFDVNIDYYATIDFYAFIRAIDALGGIRLDISRDEFYGVNHAISKYNKDLRLPFGTGYLTEYGENVLLDGTQALGYARNRQFKDGDFSRTEHQRHLMTVLYDRVKNAGLSELDALLNAFLPGITTNIPESQMLSWMLLMRKFLNYDLKTWHIPADGSYRETYIGGAAVLTVDLDTNRRVLHDIIHGTAEEPAA